MADLSPGRPGSPLRMPAPGRPSRSLWWSRRAGLLVGAAGLATGAVIVGVLDVIARPESPSAQIFVETLAWGWIAALASGLLLDAVVVRQPYLHFTVALVSVVVAFGALFIWYIGTHAAFSRWAIVIAVAYTVLVQAGAWHRWRKRTVVRLGVVDEEMLQRLAPASRFPSEASAIARCDWVYLGDGFIEGSVDGIVLPNAASAALRQRTALRAKLAGAQIYSESFVRSLLTGRLDIDRAAEVFLDDVPTSVIYATVKRLIDIAGALLLAVPSIPLVLLAASLIRLETAGPAFLILNRASACADASSACRSCVP